MLVAYIYRQVMWFCAVCLACIAFQSAAGSAETASNRDSLDPNWVQPNSIGYKTVTRTLSLRNPWMEPLTVVALEATLKNGAMRVNHDPAPIFQLIPFFDTLVVVVRNLGWGPFDAKSLALLEPQELSFSGYTLADLFDIKSAKVDFTEIRDLDVLLFRLGPRSLPFTFNGVPIRLSEYSAPLTSLETLGIRTRTYTVGHLVSERRGVLAPFTGEIAMHGRVERRARPPIGARFFGGSLALRNLDKNDAAIWNGSRYWPSAGTLMADWRFNFGSIESKPVYETKTSEMFGLRIFLGDETAKTVTVAVGHDIAPNERLPIDLEIATGKSADFSIGITVVYRLQDGQEKRFPLPGELTGATYVPRPLNLDFEDTSAVLELIANKDTNLEDRAKKYISNLTNAFSAHIPANLHQMGQDQSWRIRDALVVLLNSHDRSHKTIGVEFISTALSALTRGTAKSHEDQTELARIVGNDHGNVQVIDPGMRARELQMPTAGNLGPYAPDALAPPAPPDAPPAPRDAAPAPPDAPPAPRDAAPAPPDAPPAPPDAPPAPRDAAPAPPDAAPAPSDAAPAPSDAAPAPSDAAPAPAAPAPPALGEDQSDSLARESLKIETDFLANIFPLACRYAPDAAADLAIYKITNSPPSWSEADECVVVRESRGVLSRKIAADLQVARFLTDDPPSDTKLILACTARTSGHESLLLDSIKKRTASPQVLAYLISMNQSNSIKSIVREVLATDINNSDVPWRRHDRVELIETLTALEVGGFTTGILAFGESSYTAHADSAILAVIGYIAKFRTTDSRRFLIKAQAYQSSNEVRNAARSALGR